MFELDEEYEPDEILMDVYDNYMDWGNEEPLELSFETEREASEGLSLLMTDVGSRDSLFAFG